MCILLSVAIMASCGNLRYNRSGKIKKQRCDTVETAAQKEECQVGEGISEVEGLSVLAIDRMREIPRRHMEVVAATIITRKSSSMAPGQGSFLSTVPYRFQIREKSGKSLHRSNQQRKGRDIDWDLVWTIVGGVALTGLLVWGLIVNPVATVRLIEIVLGIAAVVVGVWMLCWILNGFIDFITFFGSV